jgi:hypothetical protein
MRAPRFALFFAVELLGYHPLNGVCRVLTPEETADTGTSKSA